MKTGSDNYNGKVVGGIVEFVAFLIAPRGRYFSTPPHGI